jgi:hypothetical protein
MRPELPLQRQLTLTRSLLSWFALFKRKLKRKRKTITWNEKIKRGNRRRRKDENVSALRNKRGKDEGAWTN